jgi:ADP-ribose pyrophosphatase
VLKRTLLKTNYTTVTEDNGKEMIERPVASALLAIDQYGDVILVEQTRGHFGKILEVPAGKVDKDEDPIDTAIREFKEETGYQANVVKPLIEYYPSVGYSTEKINCYYTEDIENTGIKELEAGEDIRVVNVGLDKVIDMIAKGEIKDSKTIMCIYSYLQLERK